MREGDTQYGKPGKYYSTLYEVEVWRGVAWCGVVW